VISEERLREAARRAGDAWEAGLPNPADCPHEFSPAFDRKMAKVLRKKSVRSSALRRVACLLLILVLGVTLFFKTDVRARSALSGWFIDHIPGAYHYFSSSETTADPDQIRYTLPEIPQGYEPYDFYTENNYVSNCYTNESGLGFSFEYIVGGSGPELYLDTHEAEAQTVYVSGSPAEFYQASSEEESNTLVWRDANTDTLFWISGFFSQDELISLAETVTLEEN
jgi:hypothetical protein